MDRREDDMASIAWPGFVDILSAVIIMFVFFVMVIVVVLYIYTIKFTATVEQQAQQRIEETIKNINRPENLDELEKEKSKTIEEIKLLEEQKKEIQQEVSSLKDERQDLISGASKSTFQDIVVNEDEIVILFEHNAVTLTENIVNKIKEFLKNVPKPSAVVIKSGDNPLVVTQSNSREINLSRMMNLRNIVLSSGYKSNQISVRYVEKEKIKGNYNWVKLRFE